MTYHDAQHLIPHDPPDDGGQDDAPIYCDDCGERIAHDGAECLTCAANTCHGCGAPLDDDGLLTHCSVRCWQQEQERER